MILYVGDAGIFPVLLATGNMLLNMLYACLSCDDVRERKNSFL